MATITVVGTGYVGLVTAAGMAHLGHSVTCVDIDELKIARLNSGESPIFERGLLELLHAGTAANRLSFQVDHDPQSLAADFVYICVPTPQRADGAADLSYLDAAISACGPHLAPGATIVNKSTVPVGSTDYVQQIANRDDIHIVSNPEFLREGTAVGDFLQPDRIVVGAEDQHAAQRVADLYEGIETTTLVTDSASAELIKYASNAFLATKLSFINGIAAVCEGVSADIRDVRQGMGLDARIGLDFMQPGPGWGGSCFPKDAQVMLQIAEAAGYDFEVLQAAVTSNDAQFDRVAAKVAAACGGTLEGKLVGVLGLAFKAGTDDTRLSPALSIISRLLASGASVRAFDPAAHAPQTDIAIVSDAYDACEGVDVVVVLTEWPEFASLDLERVAAAMRGTTVIDTRGILDADSALRAKLELVSIGRN